MRLKGTLTDWNDDKGFGFITPEGGGKRVFAHVKAFENRERRPASQQAVSYIVETDEQGRARASSICYAGERLARKAPKPANRPRDSSLSVWIGIFFVALLTAATAAGYMHWAIPAVYGTASLAAFAAYAEDKTAAQAGHWRIQESTLHGLSLIGGWPGALAAQRRLRHKSRKQSFVGR